MTHYNKKIHTFKIHNDNFMVGVAQLVEHKVVALVAAGSSPVAHPIFYYRDGCLGRLFFLWTVTAPVAQLDRASDFESAGRRFDSCRAHHKNFTLRNRHP